MNRYTYVIIDNNDKLILHESSREKARRSKKLLEENFDVNVRYGDILPYKIVRYSSPEVIR